jgi:hypothetical protein
VGIWASGNSQLARCVNIKEHLDYEWVPFATNVNLFVAGAIDATVAMSYNEYYQLLQTGLPVNEKCVYRLSEHGYNIQEDGYTGDNRSILAENLLKSPIVDWAYQQNPTNTVYIVRKDGVLVTFTFMREQEIWAWAEHESYNGKYKSVCCVPENGKDRVYFLVERKITDSLTRYFLEEQVIREFGEDSESSCFVDCAYEYSSDTPQSSVSVGLLSGLPVAGVADGSAFYVQNTISGTIELPQPAKHIIVGLPYEMEVVTVDPDIKGQDGTRFGSRKTLGQVTFELLETATLHAGADAAHMEVLKIPTTKQWGEPVVLYSGKFRSPIPGFARNEASVRFTSNDPFPATVLAVRTEVNVE